MNAGEAAKQELERINYPGNPWVAETGLDCDVAIIGAGMAGLAASFALKRLGIENIKIFDQNKPGFEGPWCTFARMPILRSTKELTGPSLDVPALTYRSYFESLHEPGAWAKLGKIQRADWMEYLRWLREILHLPIENDTKLHRIIPDKHGLVLKINGSEIRASKVVLATGRGGFGGSRLPECAYRLPGKFFAHTNDQIDFRFLAGKRVGIIGAGASGFDAAATALESGACRVDIIVRRPHLPSVNKGASTTYAGFVEGFWQLADRDRWNMMRLLYSGGTPPPVEALERVKQHKNFAVYLQASIQSVRIENEIIYLSTAKGEFAFDFLIFATGFEIDGRKQPELAEFFNKILLWSDRKEVEGFDGPGWFFRSPYLGPHYQFLEKAPGTAPYLGDIYCFNYAATLSHGQLSGDIPGIGAGAWRLARGIASDLFKSGFKVYYERLKDYKTPELSEDHFKFFK